MSSPITPLDQAWAGTLGGIGVSASYAAQTRSVSSVLQNNTTQVFCYVQTEPHLKQGQQTVGELGPDQLGDIQPGGTARSTVSVDSEPALADVAFDGYVLHVEVFDCGGPGPQPVPVRAVAVSREPRGRRALKAGVVKPAGKAAARRKCWLPTPPLTRPYPGPG